VNRQTAVAIAIGLVVVAWLSGLLLQTTRKHRVELTGSVLRIRSHSVDPETTVVFADIRVSNPSTQQFVVKEVDVYMDDRRARPSPRPTPSGSSRITPSSARRTIPIS
jgi:hypothetical protein